MEALESVLLYRAPTLRAVEKHGENIALVYSEVKSFESILRTFTGLVALNAVRAFVFQSSSEVLGSSSGYLQDSVQK